MKIYSRDVVPVQRFEKELDLIEYYKTSFCDFLYSIGKEISYSNIRMKYPIEMSISCESDLNNKTFRWIADIKESGNKE